MYLNYPTKYNLLMIIGKNLIKPHFKSMGKETIITPIRNIIN